jgi:hypothetical protein
MNTKNYTPAFPFLPILTLIFITLKLTGYIAWSWFWVLSPIWVPVAVFLVILAVLAILYLMDDKRG